MLCVRNIICVLFLYFTSGNIFTSLLVAQGIAAEAAPSSKILELSAHRGTYNANSFLEILEDKAGTLTFEDIRSAKYSNAFTPFSGTRDPNFGYTSSVFWARLRVRSVDAATAQHAHTDWFLSVEYPHLDSIRFYAPATVGAVQSDSLRYEMWQSGDMLPFSSRAIEYRMSNFRLPERGNAVSVLYFRFRSESSLSIPVIIRSAPTMNSHIGNEQFVLGLFYGILVIMLVYNLLMYFSLRDISYWYYVLYITFYGMFLLDWSGLSFQYLWPNAPIWHNFSMPFFIGLAGFTTVRFTKAYLDTRNFFPRVHKFLSFAEAYSLMGSVLAFVLPYGQAMKVLYVVILTTIPLLIAISAISLQRGYRPARYFLLGWVLLLGSITMTVVGVLNLFPTGLFLNYGLQVGSALEIFMLSMGLADRIAVMEREKKQAQQEAMEHQKVMIEVLQQSEQALERKVVERTAELSDANEEIQRQMEVLTEQAMEIELANNVMQEKHLEIESAHKRTTYLLGELSSSIRYAERIQHAMLPSEERLQRILGEYVLFFRPRSVVSGDFYWCARGGNDRIYVAAVDCTGHGVPGAFMSLIGNSLLNEIVRKNPSVQPHEILEELDIGVRRVLHQKETSNRDGMDMCLCAIDRTRGVVEYAGAKNPLYVWFDGNGANEGRLEEYKATRRSIGGKNQSEIKFELIEIAIASQDVGALRLYLSSDGYKDQLNAARKKYLSGRMRELLAETGKMGLEENGQKLGEEFDMWRGDEEQIDDVLVLGVKV